MRRFAIVAGLLAVMTCNISLAGDDAGGIDALRGNWIVRAYPDGSPWALLKIDGIGQRPLVSLLAVGFHGLVDPEEAAVEDVRIEDGAVRFRLRLIDRRIEGDFVVRPRAGEEDPRVLIGSVDMPNGFRSPARLEGTDRDDLDGVGSDTPAGALDELARSSRAAEVEDRIRILDGIVETDEDEPIALTAAMAVVTYLGDAEANRVRAAADRSFRIAEPFGPEMELYAVHRAAWRMVETESLTEIGLDYARRAEELLRPSEPDHIRVSVLRTLAAALRKTGNPDEARAVHAQAEQIDEALDREYVETARRIEPRPIDDRRERGGRVAVLELFTGARCQPCVAADLAFDALRETFGPEEVVLVQYHLHVPGFDPLTNAQGEARGRYYGVPGTPWVFVDGEELPGIGGSVLDAETGYDAMRARLIDRLEIAPGAELSLEASRDGDRIAIRAGVSRLERTGDAIRLRFLVVEDLVRYPGVNGIRLHHHVVRAFPGGVEGFPLLEGDAEHALTMDVSEVLDDLNQYLDGHADQRYYPDNHRPIDFGRLSVIALIQDDESRSILQAARVQVDRDREHH